MVVACLYVSFSCNKKITPQLVMVVCPLLCCEKMGNDSNFDILGPCLEKSGSDNLTRVSCMEALTIKGEIMLQKNSTLGLMVLMCFNDQIMVS
jgi:hypothetical protein